LNLDQLISIVQQIELLQQSCCRKAARDAEAKKLKFIYISLSIAVAVIAVRKFYLLNNRDELINIQEAKDFSMKK
jgi:hypothetical protein